MLAQCFTIVIVICHLFHLHLTAAGRVEDYRRNTGNKEKRQCVIETFDAHFEGNNSTFATICRDFVYSFESDSIPDFFNSYQTEINSFSPVFCVPDCGSVLFDAFEDCEFFSTAQRQYLTDLCGMNENGDNCYELLYEAFVLATVERGCNATCLAVWLSILQLLL